MNFNINEFVNFANLLADLASKTSMQYFRKKIEVENKEDESPVTIADKEAEQIIRDKIKKNFQKEINFVNETVKDVEKNIYELISLSDPYNLKKTIFIYPEGIITSIYFKDLKFFKDIFKENYNINHKVILGINSIN